MNTRILLDIITNLVLANQHPHLNGAAIQRYRRAAKLFGKRNMFESKLDDELIQVLNSVMEE